MVTLTLTKTFVTLVSTGVSISAYTRDRSQGYTMQGDVRTMASGRQRSVTVKGERTTYTFTLIDVTEVVIVTLREWKGQTVQVRDNRGRLFYGHFFDVPVAEHGAHESTLSDVALTLRGVTYPEGV